ncbi:MAG: zinc-finger domain-containing protein [Rhodospirillaceae bacterium]|nr:zinc-finger domain-containing protein [Rhodospirillaceae bacterium]
MKTINLETEAIVVEELNISCDGDGGVLGHPRVFLSLEGGEAQCPYCDRRFVTISARIGGNRH